MKKWKVTVSSVPFFENLIGIAYVRQMIKEGKSAGEIKAMWQDDVARKLQHQTTTYMGQLVKIFQYLCADIIQIIISYFLTNDTNQIYFGNQGNHRR